MLWLHKLIVVDEFLQSGVTVPVLVIGHIEEGLEMGEGDCSS